MKITIDENAAKKVNLSVPEVLMICLVRTGVDIKELIESMKEKQMLVEEHSLLGCSLLVNARWSERCDDALLSADNEVPQKDRLEALAKSLMEIFPSGRKEGTS